ncbi:MAG: protein-methionine-sulfoxide reductase heme-binding subunit MsrQ [Pseudomonadota bacterium]
MTQTFNATVRKVPAWLLYVILPIPGLVVFYMGLTGGLGPEPINVLERELGEFALRLLIAGLAITPLLRFAKINLVKFRRALGIMAFVYVFAHLLTWLVLDVQILSQIWADILKRPYITVGMVAFALMVPLVATSNNWSVRRLGPRWRKLHRLTYPVAILGAVHFVMLSRGFQIEPLIYLVIVVAFLATRVPQWRKSRARPV